MKVAITGADGFLGRHLRTRLRAAGGVDVMSVGRDAFADGRALAEAIKGSDAVVHLAGVNRADPMVVEAGNQMLADRLVEALDLVDEAPLVLFANSIQAGTDTPYGRGKQAAADILATWADKRGTALVDIVYQNLYGEGGRPDYNSFVATFCHTLAHGGDPEIVIDRAVELIHAQEAAQTMIDHLGDIVSTRVVTHGVPSSVGEVLTRLRNIASGYAEGRFPDLADPFTMPLFNTYRSFLYPWGYPVSLTVRTDSRGGFIEAVKASGGESQASFSTTRPGITRGNHFHLRKVERFLVVKGAARIAIRPVHGTRVDDFDVCGESPSFVDIPTLHTHNITNVGPDDLYTLFWTNEIFDPTDDDTFADPV